jgi:hypothetical protein
MKFLRLFILLPAVLALSCSTDPPADKAGEYDSRAINHLDQLTDVFGEMHSASFTLHVVDGTSSRQQDVYLLGPDKFYFHSVTDGTGLRRGLWFDGSKMSLFNYDSMNFAEIDVEGNILDAIEVMSAEYRVEFPAGDFFYPSLTDDLIADFEFLWYLGEFNVDDVDTVLIQAKNAERVLSIWIEAGTHLPYMMAISSPGQDTNDYEAVFMNWRVDPNLPDILFEFEPPEGSTEVDFGPSK